MIYLLFFIATILILAVFLYQVQYFIVFDPKKHRKEELDEKFSLLEIKAEDGTLLEGAEYCPLNFKHTLFYVGGRSQDTVGLIHKLSRSFEDCRILTFNYRGYGDSKGMPSEQNIYGDVLHVAKRFLAHYGDFSIIGFSIGSSAAAYAASKLKVQRLFLLGGFDSVRNIFLKRGFPSFLIKYDFNTALYVKDVDADTYLISSQDDDVVPIENARNLKSRIKKLTEYKELSGCSHDEILFSDETINLVKRVLS
ncbi:alpha/beta hydrolase [Sulfurimonas sp. HSL-1716]|uniref:alpha/beta hydrolase n=1 Tax=Hydrocurvibacter sulfurireducens TaxID=3131937 RepID=UPI0031F99CAC